MQEITIVSQRTICDSVADELQKKKIDDKKAIQLIDVSSEMMQYCRGARNRYRNFLNETKDQKEKTNEEKRK